MDPWKKLTTALACGSVLPAEQLDVSVCDCRCCGWKQYLQYLVAAFALVTGSFANSPTLLSPILNLGETFHSYGFNAAPCNAFPVRTSLQTIAGGFMNTRLSEQGFAGELLRSGAGYNAGHKVYPCKLPQNSLVKRRFPPSRKTLLQCAAKPCLMFAWAA